MTAVPSLARRVLGFLRLRTACRRVRRRITGTVIAIGRCVRVIGKRVGGSTRGLGIRLHNLVLSLRVLAPDSLTLYFHLESFVHGGLVLECTRSLATGTTVAAAAAVARCRDSSSRRGRRSRAHAAVSGEARGFGVGHGCRQVVAARGLCPQEIEGRRRSGRIGARGRCTTVLLLLRLLAVVRVLDAVPLVRFLNVRVEVDDQIADSQLPFVVVIVEVGGCAAVVRGRRRGGRGGRALEIALYNDAAVAAATARVAIATAGRGGVPRGVG